MPVNLATRVPEGVSDEDAAFATVASIALQGLRIAEPTLGESVAVIGLGLLGQLAVSMFKANGCRVLAVDLDPTKVALALKRGADAGSVRNTDDTVGDALRFTDGRGADVAYVAAAAKTNDPLVLAGEICRDRGRVVVVGALPMEFPRKDYYEKELALLFSRSYGPGRYNAAYEGQGLDFPAGYVRWTEGRNLGPSSTSWRAASFPFRTWCRTASRSRRRSAPMPCSTRRRGGASWASRSATRPSLAGPVSS